ncbi:MAG: hypothetical protein KF795_20185 [Labilithrix sp.]|nr:hypothetical protein [Labilithrix sp.]
MKVPALSPGRWLLVGAVGCLLAAVLTVFAATRAPWLGLTLAPPSTEGEAGVRIVSARGPSAEVPAGTTLVSVAVEGGPSVELERTDLIEEPDYFDRYADMARFFHRQSELVEVLRHPRVVLALRYDGGPTESFVVEPAARRPLSALPGVFWFQLSAGSIGFFVSLWVFVLRPRVVGVQMFALAGAMILGFTAPAAIYSTRELAIDGGLFRLLSSMNHLGANVFGIGLVGIFVVFPAPLARPRALWLLPAVFIPWFVLDATWLARDQSWGSRAPIVLELLLAVAFAVVQWRRARSDPRARASLRWFGVCVLTGAGLFVVSVVGTSLLGMFPPIPQGYSFGFFLLMHVGLALGLRQTRLFELDELAYVVLFWVVGALALVGLDAALLLLLDTNRLLSSALALFVLGLAYLPVRSWVWSRALSRRTVDEERLFRSVLDVVFAAIPEDRVRRYRELFDALFSPLEIEPAGEGEVREVAVTDGGLRMIVPAVSSLPALRLAFPWRGRGLFGERHAKLTVLLLELAEHAENARSAFDRGVREERARVARDLHDDVGAALTTALYHEDPDEIRQTVRLAIGEMRSMVDQLTGSRPRLSDILGNLRHETTQRLAAARIAPKWPLLDFGDATMHPAVARNFTSMVREIVSNVVRHAGASTLTVEVRRDGEEFVATLTDDGSGFDVDAPGEGNGLRNLRRRAKDVGGTIRFARRDLGTEVTIALPLDV